MSSFTTESFLYKIANSPEMADKFRQSPETVLDGFPLSDTERADLIAWNVRSIADTGVSPMLLMFGYVAVHGPKHKDYIGLMKQPA